MFKVNNKDIRTYFTPCSSVSIVNFEHVIVSLALPINVLPIKNHVMLFCSFLNIRNNFPS